MEPCTIFIYNNRTILLYYFYTQQQNNISPQYRDFLKVIKREVGTGMKSLGTRDGNIPFKSIINHKNRIFEFKERIEMNLLMIINISLLLLYFT